jgi:hypothetical protein
LKNLKLRINFGGEIETNVCSGQKISSRGSFESRGAKAYIRKTKYPNTTKNKHKEQQFSQRNQLFSKKIDYASETESVNFPYKTFNREV